MTFRSGWNMPPGVFESDIPGNRPEDEAREAQFERWWDMMLEEARAEGRPDFLDDLSDEEIDAAFEHWLQAQPAHPVDAGIEPDPFDEPY